MPGRNREANIRWREWQAHGAERDRRTVTIMSSVAMLLGLGLVVLFFVIV